MGFFTILFFSQYLCPHYQKKCEIYGITKHCTMKLQFRIHYKTNWGETLFVSGNCPELGDWNPEDAIPLHYNGNDFWQTELELNESFDFAYKYFIRNNDGSVFWEGGNNRDFWQTDKEHVFIQDSWQVFFDAERVLLSKVFVDVIMRPELQDETQYPYHAKKIIRLAIERRVLVLAMHLQLRVILQCLGIGKCQFCSIICIILFGRLTWMPPELIFR